MWIFSAQPAKEGSVAASNRACGFPTSEAPASLPGPFISEAPSSFHPLEIRFPPQRLCAPKPGLAGVQPAAQRGEGQAGLWIPEWCARKDLRAAKHPAARSWHSLVVRGSAALGIRNPAGNEQGADLPRVTVSVMAPEDTRS